MRTIPKVQKEWSSETQQLAVQVTKLKKKIPERNPSRVVSKANKTKQLDFVAIFYKTKALHVFSVSPKGKEKLTGR